MTAPAKAPNYWLGLILNVLLVGSGFTYIGTVAWHLIWLGIWVVGWLLGGALVAVVVSASQGAPTTAGFGLTALALIMLGVLVLSLLQYQRTYARLYGAGQVGSPITDGLRWCLISGHAVLGLLSALLLPALLLTAWFAPRRISQAHPAEQAQPVSLQTAADRATSRAHRSPPTDVTT